MIKYIFAPISLLITLVSNSSAQTYNIKSLNGKVEQITVTPDYPDNTLNILSSNDTIHIYEVTGIKSITVLKEHFLKIEYSVRGGSEESLQHLLIISIMDNKIYQSAHFLSLLKYDVNTVYDKEADSLKLFDEHGDYGVGIGVVGDDKESYKLVVNLQDEIKSKHDPKTNLNNKEQVSLAFDPNNYIFYNAHEVISQYFTIYDTKLQRAVKQYILGEIPVIRFGNHKYYYIKDEWYGKGHDDKLLKYTYK